MNRPHAGTGASAPSQATASRAPHTSHASQASLLPASVPPETLAAEAARFALLCRLTPALRHEAAAPMQPLAMAASVLERRLATASPDPVQLRDGVQKLVDYSRKAVQGGLDLVSWLTPDRQARRPLGGAVEDVLGLLATPLGFEGFTVQATLGPSEAALPVNTGALRLLLPACLLWLTDQVRPPGAVTLVASRWASAVVLRLSLARPPSDARAASGRISANGGSPEAEAPEYESPNEKAGPRREPAYRRLGDAELMALARSEGLGLDLQGEALELTVACEP